MVQFDRNNFGKMSKAEKKKFIDELLERGLRLNKAETIAATREQKKRYIDNLISQVKEFERHEIEAATDKQMKMYINKKRWLSIAEYGQLPSKFKKMYIDMTLSKKSGLTNEEFENTPSELRTYYCKQAMESGFEIGPKMFAYMHSDDQKKYIDFALAAGHKLTMEYELFMKPGVKSHYDNSVQTHPYLWENQIRKQIRKIIFESKQTTFIDVLNSDEAFDIIDQSKAPNTTPMEGACWIVADALSMALNKPLYAVYNKKTDRIEHFLVKVGKGTFVHARGFESETQVLRDVIEDLEMNDITLQDLVLVPYEEVKNKAKNIVRDIEASKKIAELLQNVM